MRGRVTRVHCANRVHIGRVRDRARSIVVYEAMMEGDRLASAAPIVGYWSVQPRGGAVAPPAAC